jgi:leucine-zipper of insertion element IS481
MELSPASEVHARAVERRTAGWTYQETGATSQVTCARLVTVSSSCSSPASQQCLSKWVGRYRVHGEAGLVDRSSAPLRHPGQLASDVVAEIERPRRTRKLSARLIAVG